MTAKWIAGWNQPGYMPENDPCEPDTWLAARDALLFDVQCADEGAWGATEAQLDTAQAELEAAQSDQPLLIQCGTHVLWIEPEA